jgi:hypothetical protein
LPLILLLFLSVFLSGAQQARQRLRSRRTPIQSVTQIPNKVTYELRPHRKPGALPFRHLLAEGGAVDLVFDFALVLKCLPERSACAVEGPLCNPLLNFRTRSPTRYGHIANRVPYPSAIFWRRVGQLTLPLILILSLILLLKCHPERSRRASACAVEGPLCNPLLNFRARSPTRYGHIANRVPYPSAIFWRRVG